jgi:hypothetical protein
MDEKQAQLVIRLLTEHIWWLRNAIREQESLSVPCPPGRWRWGDVKTGGYGRKPDDELAADRARAVQRAADYRDELDVAESAWRALSSVPA